MEENLQILNNILIVLDQLEIKSSRQNSIIMYNIYVNIDKLIKNLNEKPNSITEKKVKIIDEEEKKE